jgi:hypothetical protein
MAAMSLVLPPSSVAARTRSRVSAALFDHERPSNGASVVAFEVGYDGGKTSCRLHQPIARPFACIDS